MVADVREEQFGHLPQVVGVQIQVVFDALFLFVFLKDVVVEIVLAQAERDIGEHHNKAAVRIVDKAGVVGLFDQGVNRGRVEAQVQNGIHHAGHGELRARTHGYEQGLFAAAELAAHLLFHIPDGVLDGWHQVGGDLLAVGIVGVAGIGGNGKAGGNGQADVGHFGEVGALATQQVAHGLVAIGKQIDALRRCCGHNWSGLLLKRVLRSTG